jgi:prevent-host-death family protein
MMTTMWTVQDAKTRFSELVANAISEGPQYVTRKGVRTVVVVSVKEYERLTSNRPDFREFLLDIPKIDEPLVFERCQEYPGSVEL